MIVLLTPSQLTWAHFRKASWVGFLLLPLCGALVGAAESWTDQPGYPSPAGLPLGIRAMGSLDNGMAWLLGSAFWGSIFIGIPTLLFGLLRQPLMRLLFAFCWPLAPQTAWVMALVGTFVIFEIPVWLVAQALPYPQAFGYSRFLFSFGVSLPWLLGSVWATWALLREQL